MYEYLIGIVLIILTFILFYKRETKKTMAHVVGRLATKFVENMLEQVRQKLISDGYENWKFDIYQKEFTIAELLSCHVTMKDLVSIGVSKFVTNDVSYDVATSTANFDISIPKLYLGVGDASANAMIQAFGMDFAAQIKGWITLMEPRVTGAVVLDINDEGKVTATSIDINVELKDVQSKIDLNAMETDYSEAVNNFLQAKLPHLINTYVNSCKAAIELGLMSIANPILAQYVPTYFNNTHYFFYNLILFIFMKCRWS